MKYRSEIDIMCQILKVANGAGATKTRITYGALLSFPQVKKFTTNLTERGLVHYDRERHTFKTTEKGLRLLREYNHLDELMNKR
jgi:predicted transcriptional regulator